MLHGFVEVWLVKISKEGGRNVGRLQKIYSLGFLTVIWLKVNVQGSSPSNSLLPPPTETILHVNAPEDYPRECKEVDEGYGNSTVSDEIFNKKKDIEFK